MLDYSGVLQFFVFFFLLFHEKWIALCIMQVSILPIYA